LVKLGNLAGESALPLPSSTSLAKYVKIKSAPARLILVSVSKITFFYINPALLSGSHGMALAADVISNREVGVISNLANDV